MGFLDSLFGENKALTSYTGIAADESANLLKATSSARKKKIKQMEDYLRGMGATAGGGEVTQQLADIESQLQVPELQMIGEHTKAVEQIKLQEAARRKDMVKNVLKAFGTIAGNAIGGPVGADIGDIAGEMLSTAVTGESPTGVLPDIASIIQIKATDKANKEQSELNKRFWDYLFPGDSTNQPSTNFNVRKAGWQAKQNQGESAVPVIEGAIEPAARAGTFELNQEMTPLAIQTLIPQLAAAPSLEKAPALNIGIPAQRPTPTRFLFNQARPNPFPLGTRLWLLFEQGKIDENGNSIGG
jgi:hypothetical protein